MPAIAKVFISYSHDTQEHKRWVLELATRLRNNSIDAILDQFELKGGDDVPHFMETNLMSADKVIMICSEKYVQKANEGDGGVGYEKMIVTGQMMSKISEAKVIPIIRQNISHDVPTFLKTKLYINFSKEDDFEFSYDELVRAIKGKALFEKPKLEEKPFEVVKKEKLEEDVEIKNQILKSFVWYYELGIDNVDSKSLAKKIKVSRVYVEIIMKKFISEGLFTIPYSGNSYNYSITDKGKLYAHENNLI